MDLLREKSKFSIMLVLSACRLDTGGGQGCHHVERNMILMTSLEPLDQAVPHAVSGLLVTEEYFATVLSV